MDGSRAVFTFHARTYETARDSIVTRTSSYQETYQSLARKDQSGGRSHGCHRWHVRMSCGTYVSQAICLYVIVPSLNGIIFKQPRDTCIRLLRYERDKYRRHFLSRAISRSVETLRRLRLPPTFAANDPRKPRFFASTTSYDYRRCRNEKAYTERVNE